MRHCSVRGIFYTRFLTFAPLSALLGEGLFLVIRRVCVAFLRRHRGRGVVRSGDTLGGIAAYYRVNMYSIHGYRSGNPALIYPGETLYW